MHTVELQQIARNTKEGVTIIYLAEQQKWGVQFKGKQATFYPTFDKVIKELTTEHGATN